MEEGAADLDILIRLIEENKIDEFSNLLTGDQEESSENPYVTLMKQCTHLSEPLKTAALIPGRTAFIEQLAGAGVDVAGRTECTGYAVLHLAACWGLVPALRTLVRLGAEIKAETLFGETAEDMAIRYEQKEAMKFFECLTFQQSFREEIAYARSVVLTPENFTGKLSKDDKTRITKVSDEKSNWLDANSLTSTHSEVSEQREDFRSKLNTVLEKVKPVEERT